jgi:hypothetical protein
MQFKKGKALTKLFFAQAYGADQCRRGGHLKICPNLYKEGL